MNRTQRWVLSATATLLLAAVSVHTAFAAPRRLTAQDIFQRSEKTVIQVIAGASTGTGFIVSPDGLAATANHVVTTRLFVGNQINVQYIPNIHVTLSDGRVVEAQPAVAGSPPADWVAHDFALLKIREKNLPCLLLGSWTDVQVGEELTVIGFAFTPPTLVSITATVSGRNAIQNPTGIPSLVDAVIFQGPINRGLSGAPLISNRTGKVIGIVSTKLAGVPLDLYSLRDKISASSNQNPPATPSWARDQAILEVINTLDQSLISGMGGAVAIDYARDASESLARQEAVARNQR